MTEQEDFQEIVISSEDEAYHQLERLLQQNSTQENDIRVDFDGWPHINIYLKGEQFHQSINTSVMKALVDYQQEIYRTYALMQYNSSSTRRLTQEDRKQLELVVNIKPGSSDLTIDIGAILTEAVKGMGSLMTPLQLTVTIITIALAFGAKSAFNSYLSHIREKQAEQNRSDEEKIKLNALSLANQSGKRFEDIVEKAATQVPKINSHLKAAEDATVSLVKGLESAEEAVVQDVSMDGETARILTSNTRRTSKDVTITGDYRISMLENRKNKGQFRVRVHDISNNDEFNAALPDEAIINMDRVLLTKAILSKRPVRLVVEAKELVGGELRSAKIQQVMEIQPPDVNKH